ncbi:MAG TPA: F0F1 ATP synthase subunit A [Candidatus Sulfomarinibacteraceae bacterium]|nr:F0F1 ATP synthase subunit A [Candidatus Sulfomarinibacteraceae bacterium]
MEHAVSILYHPINKILIALFGESSEQWQSWMNLHNHGYWLPDNAVMSILVVVIIALVVIPISRRLSVESPGKLQSVLEVLITGLRDLIEDVVGHGTGSRFLPIICSLAFFIFVGNIFGIFYFVQPPTADPSTTFALSITAFIFYNVVGIKDNGVLKYMKHFLGPVIFLAPLMFVIELISHAARILSLAIRLFGNIFGEHSASAIFFSMFPFLLPWPMMVLGIFGSLLQAFIFIMLTMAYLNGAVGAEEH